MSWGITQTYLYRCLGSNTLSYHRQIVLDIGIPASSLRAAAISFRPVSLGYRLRKSCLTSFGSFMAWSGLVGRMNPANLNDELLELTLGFQKNQYASYLHCTTTCTAE